jgi:hypothetical protein
MSAAWDGTVVATEWRTAVVIGPVPAVPTLGRTMVRSNESETAARSIAARRMHPRACVQRFCGREKDGMPELRGVMLHMKAISGAGSMRR